MSLKRLTLKPGKDQSLRRYHPWVFSGAIEKMSCFPEEGECVAVFSDNNECLGIGHYQSGSIAVRIIHFGYAEPSQGFWQEKVNKALQLRTDLGLYDDPQTSVFRLVNAEGDGFPGLIADYYNGSVVLQAHSAGMCRIIAGLSEAIKEVLGERLKGIYDKTPAELKARAGIDRVTNHLAGELDETIVKEYGCSFRVNWVGGQKTGFFIDQRENRKLLEYYSSGRKVLNMFAYTGGFSVYALRGGAERVETVDSSRKAVDLARENIELNFPGDSRSISVCSEVYDYFNTLAGRYDIIVLDPPAFAKSRKSRNNALQAYRRLNAKALDYIEPGGLIFTFSCSQVVGVEDFRQAVFSAAIQSGREISILHHLSQPADHPVSIYHPEGGYLKGLVLRVT
jgi:23S rRNA (cytosine1962-C5)-methyltransferase